MKHLSLHLALSGLLIASAARGATINWTNTAGGNWSTAANWSPNILPGAGDTAVINAPGSYTVTNTSARTLAGLTVGGGGSAPTLNSSGIGSLTVTNGTLVATNAALAFSGTTFGGSSVLMVEGAMRWTGGTITAGVSAIVASNATLTLDGTATKVLSGTLTNRGTLTWTNTGLFQILAGGRVHNASNALFEVHTDSALDYVSGVTAVVVNEGELRKRFATGLNNNQVPIVNRGTADIQSGTFAYAAGTVFEDGSLLTGSGTNLVTAATTFNGNIYSDNLVLSAGTYNGTNTLSGLVRWLAGTFGSASAVTVGTNGQLLLDGTATKSVSGVLTNNGLLTWTNTGAFQITSGGSVHNASNALFAIKNDALVDYVSGNVGIVNRGTIRKTLASGTNSWQVPLTNYGVVDVQSGAMAYAGGSALQDGSQFTGAGLSLFPGGNVTWSGRTTSENIFMNGATLTGTGELQGTMRWQSGTFAAGLTLTVATNSVLQLESASAKSLGGAVTNCGTVRWQDSGIFQILSGGVLHNKPEGLFLIQTDAVLDYVSGTAVLVNLGVLRKTAGAGVNVFQLPLVNSGLVDIQTGAISLHANNQFSTGTHFTGAGQTRLMSGTTTFNGQILSDNLVLDGATVTGSGSFLGSLDWLSGTLSASLDLTIPTNGLLHLAGASAKTVSGTVTNAGLIRWEGTGNFQLLGPSRLHNLPSGIIDAQSDALLDYVSGSPLFINEGVFKKTGGTNVTTSQILVRNSGAIEVNIGTVNLTVGMTNSGGRVKLGGGKLQLPGGATLRLNGGRFEGFGLLQAHLHNDGAVSPASSNGVLTVSGNYTQALTGMFEVELRGLGAGTNHSRLTVNNNVALDGSITVTRPNGFLPATNDVFDVLGYATRSGDFRCQNGFFLLGQNRRLVEEFGVSVLALRAVAAPDPAGASLKLSSAGNLFVLCWPYEFPGFRLQSSTNLLLTNWTDVALTTSNMLLTIGTLPQQYFRLVQP